MKKNFKKLTKKHKDMIDDIILTIDFSYPYLPNRKKFESSLRILKDLEDMNLIDLELNEHDNRYYFSLRDLPYDPN